MIPSHVAIYDDDACDDADDEENHDNEFCHCCCSSFVVARAAAAAAAAAAAMCKFNLPTCHDACRAVIKSCCLRRHCYYCWCAVQAQSPGTEFVGWGATVFIFRSPSRVHLLSGTWEWRVRGCIQWGVAGLVGLGSDSCTMRDWCFRGFEKPVLVGAWPYEHVLYNIALGCMHPGGERPLKLRFY